MATIRRYGAYTNGVSGMDGTTIASDLDVIITEINGGLDADNLADNAVTQAKLHDTVLLKDYRSGIAIKSYNSGEGVTISTGEVMLKNSGGTAWIKKRIASAVSTDMSTILDAGSWTSDTMYHLYIESDDVDDSTYNFIMSTNASAPTGVKDYYRRIGAAYTGTSDTAAVYDYHQAGYGSQVNHRSYSTTDVSVTATSWTQYVAEVEIYVRSESEPMFVMLTGAATSTTDMYIGLYDGSGAQLDWCKFQNTTHHFCLQYGAPSGYNAVGTQRYLLKAYHASGGTSSIECNSLQPLKLTICKGAMGYGVT